MVDVSELGVKVVSGEIVQISASMSQTDMNNSNTNSMYPFIMLKMANGEILKINNLVVDAHIEQHLFIGKTVTFYLKQVRHMTNFKIMNCAVAAVSESGTGILDFPARVVSAFYVQAIVGGLIVGAIASFLLTTVIGGVFYYVGSILGLLTGIYVFEYLAFVGGFIGLMSGPAFLVYVLRSAGKFADIRRVAERLRQKLDNNYRGAAVKNI